MDAFCPLRYRAFLSALPPSEQSAWQEHIPFGMLLVELMRPRLFVELGVHTGASYLAVCRAVASLGLPCRCYGVDTFQGDAHAGTYDGSVEASLRERHDPLYGGFSRLIRSTFDDAAGSIGDGTVDLLHIDGLHTYEAVAHDFTTWLPKLSPRAVVMLHDTNVRERGFGVWRLFDELRGRYPHFAFQHGHGLGVLAVGREVPPALTELLQLDAERAERVRALFFALGHRMTLHAELAWHKGALGSLSQRLGEAEAESARLRERVESLQGERLQREAAIARLQRESAEQHAALVRTNQSLSFRLGLGATAPLRWILRRLSPSPVSA